MPQRQYNKEPSKVASANPRVILPTSYDEYQTVASDCVAFRQWLDEMFATYRELFPCGIGDGYTLHDYLPASTKLPDVRFRRIKLKGQNDAGQHPVLTICSSDIMPYMTGYTDAVEKALFVRRFGVPFWGLTYVFGRTDDYWYRMATTFGRYALVGTVVKDAAQLPTDLLADEKHIHFNGEKGYIATTVGHDCVLGASLALQADEEALTPAYGYFKAEAQVVDPDYTPQTLNTDGWLATQKTWLTLFPAIILMPCFLHAWLKIRDRTKKRFKDLYDDIQRHVWDIYRAADPADFLRQVVRFPALGWSTSLWSCTHGGREALQQSR